MKNSQNAAQDNHPLHKIAKEFDQFANGTRGDFHEPDEQGIYFQKCQGTHLDNVFGNTFPNPANEVIVTCLKEGIGTRRVIDDKVYNFNLANIFALAKIGAAFVLADGVVDMQIRRRSDN